MYAAYLDAIVSYEQLKLNSKKEGSIKAVHNIKFFLDKFDSDLVMTKNSFSEFIEGWIAFRSNSSTSLKMKQVSDAEFNPFKAVYIPAERGLFELLEKNSLIPFIYGAVGEFFTLYHKAIRNYNKDFKIVFSDTSFYFDEILKVGKIKGKDFDIKLANAASGFQSAVPLLLISDYLNDQIEKGKDNNDLSPFALQEISNRFIEIEKEFENKEAPANLKNLIKNLLTHNLLQPKRFINIVEEPEQNLFPSAQRDVLYKLIEIANSIEDNQLIITTHSPYLINDTTLAIKAWQVAQQAKGSPQLLERIKAVVPEKSWLKPDEVVVYECHSNGTITKLKTYNGILSDSNMLNEQLNASNETFDELLDIQDEAKSLKSDAK